MKILVIAAQSFDEVLGVGGTIARYAHEGHEVHICIATNPGSTLSFTQRIKNEAIMSSEVLGATHTSYLDLTSGAVKNTSSLDVDARFQKFIKQVKPEIAFIPHKEYMHTDYADVARAAMAGLKPTENPQLKAIYAYEVFPEIEGNTPTADNAFIPNCYSDITDYIKTKIEAMNCYQSLLVPSPHPRALRSIEYLSRTRGTNAGFTNAEAFMVIRENI